MRITAGLAAGVIAIVRESWPLPFFPGGPRMWRLRSDGLVRDRIVREDYLEVLP